MSLSSLSMKKPVTVIMVFLGVTLFGLISWTRLRQELYPPIVYPQLSIITSYKDAAPEEMEILVTKPIEEAVGTVGGVRKISSISKEETSLVIAEFNWGTNMSFAALGVREKIDLIKESLPRGSEDPVVMKFNPFEMPLMVLNITSETISPAELRRITDKIIKNEIEKADGVAAANITGGRIPEIIIEIDQDKLMSKGLALNKVVEFIAKSNLNYPAGTIEESFYEYLVRTIGEFKMVDDISGLVIDVDDRKRESEFIGFDAGARQAEDDKPVYRTHLVTLKDIASVKEVLKEKTSVSRFNNRDNVSLSIQKQADANTLQVANSIKEILKKIKDIIPEGINISMVADQSLAVSSNIKGVADAAFQGGFLAFLVLLFFLRNIKSALIVALNIPVSIMVVFALMFLCGITINMISLGGLALGVGMLVDNGIVVIENIYRHRQEEKKDIIEASAFGASEVSGAIAGSTLTTIAVFLPMVFVIGVAGQICKDLAFTVTFSLLGSIATALALMPVLCSTVKDIPVVDSEDDSDLNHTFMTPFQSGLKKALCFFIKRKAFCLAALLIVFLFCCMLLPFLDTELLPKVDQGQFTIKLNLPPGTRLDHTDTVARKIESYLFAVPEIDSVTTNIGSTKEKKGTALLETMGPHQAQIIVNLKPKAGFGKSGPQYRLDGTSVVLSKLKDQIGPKELSGASIEYILQESVFQSAFQTEAPIVIEIRGKELGTMRNITAIVEEEIKKISGIYSVRNTLVAPAPEIKVNVFKDKAATYNLTASDIALTAQTAIKGHVATKLKREGEEIDIRVRLKPSDRDNMEKIRRLQFHTPLGVDVPLSELAYLSMGKGPSEIKRQDQERTIIVSASIFKNSFKNVAQAVSEAISRVQMPSTAYSAKLAGESEQIKESFRSLRMALVLSVLLVYMIMASQFESFWQPFVILFTIPLSIIGIILMLLFTRTPLSIMVILGVIICGGIVVNNGIVLIDYVNILRERGMSAYDAVMVSSRRRLRPILMTALTTVLGLFPLAFALNHGSELQQPMAIAIIGGLIASTFLSLVVVPVIYLGFNDIITSIKAFSPRLKNDDKLKFAPLADAGEQGHDAVKAQKPPLAPVIELSYDKSGSGGGIAPAANDFSATDEKKGRIPAGGDTPPLFPLKTEEGLTASQDNRDIWQGGFNERQKALIAYLKENGRISRKEYSEKFNISIPTAARDLKHLLKSGVIVFKGPAAIGRYYTLK
ncbi:MAG: efflux RND transporter permease subunit [Candidatus Omnitrophica bacterium]|nr:efflux RND transporter permease subunit [Candidatus Omnitrophota bacterium]